MLVRRNDHFFEDERAGGNGLLVFALSLIPLAAMAGVAIDLGMSFVMRQRLDAVAQSALASALAQSRSLRDVRFDVGVEEMEAKGKGRADLVFNAQKPSVRDIRTNFILRNEGPANVFAARVAYVASINTIFLRFVGMPDLEIEGEAATTWVARDAVIDEKFDEHQLEVVAAGRKSVTPPAGWTSSARTKVAGSPVIQLANTARYDGPPAPDGVKIAVELDTPDGNVAISRKLTVEPGAHQLRYWYRDRAQSERLAPAWLCGTREEDVEWMSARDRGGASDTNRMSVYLSPDVNNAPPPVAALNAAARVDSCYSSGYRWIERAVKIDILSRGDYWLTFRGEGRADGTGAAVANILFCREPCMDDGGLAQPSANSPWAVGQTIFEDNFVSAGDPRRAPAGWTVWPGGGAKIVAEPGAPSGAVELDVSTAEGFENQRIGRPFLLTPGFYLLRYAYSSGPTSPHKVVACNYFGLAAALQRLPRGPGADTRRITVSIDPDAPFLHPEAPAEGGRPVWYTAGRAIERDTSGLRRQTIPDPSSAVDYCVGAPPGIFVGREISFRIDKAGYYWVTFAADGPADGESGRIGSVQLVAQGVRYTGQGIPRIIRHTERGDILTPPVGSLLVQPPGASGQRALYRVQVQ